MQTTPIVLIFLLALGFLFWGYKRAQPYGKFGILSWLQSVVLMAPWFLFVGFFILGIYLNIAAFLLLLVASVIAYICLGRSLRAEGQDMMLQQPAITPLQRETAPREQDNRAPSGLPIDPEELKIIQGIFGIDTFFATETIPYLEGAIFKGNLRGETEFVHTRLSEKLKESLGEKYRLFLVEGPEDKPVVVVLPSSNDPQPATLGQKNLALVLFVATIATSLEASSLLQGFDFFRELGRFGEALPLALGLFTVLGAHEIGHRIWGRRHNVTMGLPFFIPSWQIGSFGAITRFQSVIPNRTALFEIALAGPALGGIVSLFIFILGLILSHPGSTFQIPTPFFQNSILVGILGRLVLGSALHGDVVGVNPLTMVGWLGLTITALNLIPAGQLDGGRIVQSIYGRPIARRATITTLIILGIVAFFNPANPIPLYWGIVIIFLQRGLEKPCLNELTEPDDTRAGLALLALFLMLAILIPLSPSLSVNLGIGTGL